MQEKSNIVTAPLNCEAIMNTKNEQYLNNLPR
jgi:hypothetical protein